MNHLSDLPADVQHVDDLIAATANSLHALKHYRAKMVNLQLDMSDLPASVAPKAVIAKPSWVSRDRLFDPDTALSKLEALTELVSRDWSEGGQFDSQTRAVKLTPVHPTAYVDGDELHIVLDSTDSPAVASLDLAGLEQKIAAGTDLDAAEQQMLAAMDHDSIVIKKGILNND